MVGKLVRPGVLISQIDSGIRISVGRHSPSKYKKENPFYVFYVVSSVTYIPVSTPADAALKLFIILFTGWVHSRKKYSFNFKYKIQHPSYNKTPDPIPQ